MAQLGDRVKDKISGFTGIVNARVNYLNGCTRCGVASEETHDGKLIEDMYFDETQLVIMDPVVVVPVKGAAPVGGPRTAPPSISNPG